MKKLRENFKKNELKALELIALGTLIGATRLVSNVTTTQLLIEISNRSTLHISKNKTPSPSKLKDIERWANRLSKLVPGSHCLHRASAVHILLGLEGIRSEIVIGFRKKNTLEAHAWLNVSDGDKVHILFSSENKGFNSIWIPK